jgi:predicted XRE-type DNA-binding protein
MVCSVAHCEGKVVAKGLCSKHYQAQRKYGDPTVVKQKQHHGISLKERFAQYVRRGEGCWDWLGYIDSGGYGRINVGGTPKLASRVSYLLHYGDVPKGKVVCHKCDNPKCVNPEHLFIGSQADNVRDMHDKGRARKRALFGEAHSRSKLTEDMVRGIRNCALSNTEAAELFGISRSTVYDIRKRRSWKHVE